jgi:hypothetical protein
VWPHDVESFQGSKFCLFVMVQPWNIGVCWIDQVFVTELAVIIFFVHAAVLSIKTAFNLVKIHLLFRIIPLIQWSVMFCRPCFKRFWGLKIYTPSVFRIYKYKCIINMRLLFLVYWLGWFSWLCLLHTTQVLLFLSLLSPPVKKNIMHIIHGLHHGQLGGCCGRDCMVVWFTITYAISAYHH